MGAPQTQYEFEQTVAEKTESVFAGEGWPLYREGESLDDTVRRVMPDADWVIDKDNNLHERKKHDRSYKVGLFVSDLHAKFFYDINNPIQHIEMINNAGYDAVFLRYPLLYGTGYDPKIYLRMLKPDTYWLPWSVDTQRFHRRETRYDVSFLGSTWNCYPLRQEIWDGIWHVARGYRILRERAPRGETYERDVDSLSDDYFVGKRYADAVGSSRIFIFGCSIYRYPLQKFFEATASGSLVMSNVPSKASTLGFVDNETYVAVDEHTWEEDLQYFLENEEECRKIAKRGEEMTRRNHTHEVRASQFLELLE